MQFLNQQSPHGSERYMRRSQIEFKTSLIPPFNRLTIFLQGFKFYKMRSMWHLVVMMNDLVEECKTENAQHEVAHSKSIKNHFTCFRIIIIATHLYVCVFVTNCCKSLSMPSKSSYEKNLQEMFHSGL